MQLTSTLKNYSLGSTNIDILGGGYETLYRVDDFITPPNRLTALLDQQQMSRLITQQ